ncbi:MAG: hypothetical protein MZV63_11585 [Marinilabiliales bacterium]|nr:hypothetical protein [Marinilabiliales bacterium]
MHPDGIAVRIDMADQENMICLRQAASLILLHIYRSLASCVGLYEGDKGKKNNKVL